jgi:hypothetical protein
MSQLSLNVPEWGWTFAVFSLCIGTGGALAFLVMVMRLSGIGAVDHILVRCQQMVMWTAIVGTVLQVALLARPSRVLNMFATIDSGFSLNFRWWSATSLTSWSVAVFGVVAIATRIAVHRASPSPSRAIRMVRDILLIVSGVLGVAAAIAPGVMLSSTSVPIWAASSWWGAAFLLSSMSVAAALVGAVALTSHDHVTTFWANRLDQFIAVGLIVAFVVIGLSLDELGRDALESTWGLTFLISTVLGGMILPNIFRLPGSRITMDIQVFILILVTVGSLILRAVVVFAPETLL